MGRRLIYIVGNVVALVAVGVGSFYGGTVYASQQAAATRGVLEWAWRHGRGRFQLICRLAPILGGA